MILNGSCFVCSLDLNLVFRMCLFELFGQTWPLGPIYVSNQCQVCIDKDTFNLSDYAALALAYEDPRVLIVGFWFARRKKTNCRDSVSFETLPTVLFLFSDNPVNVGCTWSACGHKDESQEGTNCSNKNRSLSYPSEGKATIPQFISLMLGLVLMRLFSAALVSV